MPEKTAARASIKAEEVELDEVTIAGTSGWVKSKGTVTDKSGAKHTPMSRARDLARQALKKVQDKTKVKNTESMLGQAGQTSESKKKW